VGEPRNLTNEVGNQLGRASAIRDSKVGEHLFGGQGSVSIYHLQFAICNLPFAICHLPFVICHLSFVSYQLSVISCGLLLESEARFFGSSQTQTTDN
jgi:hypothetical protein